MQHSFKRSLRKADRFVQRHPIISFTAFALSLTTGALALAQTADAFVTCDGCGSSAYGSQANQNAGGRSEPKPGQPVFKSCGGSCQAKGNNYGDGTRTSGGGRNSAPGKN